MKYLLLFVFIQEALSALPLGWKTCKMKEPNYNTCLKEAIQHAISTLLDGNKELQIPPLEPLKFDRLLIRGSSGGPVNIETTFTDLALPIFRSMQLDEVKNSNWKRMDIRAHTLSDVAFESHYVTKGKVLTFPLFGEGMCDILLKNVTCSIHLHFKEKLKEKNGKKYLQVEKVIFEAKPGKVEMQFKGLFNGDKRLEDNANKIFNDNWNLLWEELKPLIHEGVGQALTTKANTVLSKIPFDLFNL